CIITRIAGRRSTYPAFRQSAGAKLTVPIQHNRRAKVLFLGGVFLTCMCPLMLQVMGTRLLSVIAWYYLAFFAISLGMFGMTAGSLFVYFKSGLFPSERLQDNLGWITMALAISVVFSTVSLVSSVVL